jgi:hypothetical protein
MVIVRAGDLGPRAIGRYQSTTAALAGHQQLPKAVSCILWRPPYAHSNCIQQPPFCCPNGGRDGLNSLWQQRAATMHVPESARSDTNRHVPAITGHARGRRFVRKSHQTFLVFVSCDRASISFDFIDSDDMALGQEGSESKQGTSFSYPLHCRYLPSLGPNFGCAVIRTNLRRPRPRLLRPAQPRTRAPARLPSQGRSTVTVRGEPEARRAGWAASLGLRAASSAIAGSTRDSPAAAPSVAYRPSARPGDRSRASLPGPPGSGAPAGRAPRRGPRPRPRRRRAPRAARWRAPPAGGRTPTGSKAAPIDVAGAAPPLAPLHVGVNVEQASEHARRDALRRRHLASRPGVRVGAAAPACRSRRQR